jgi:hypothetical protein
MRFSPLFLQTLFLEMFIACYNVFYSFQSALAIGNFDQDVDIDHTLKFRIFEGVIHVLVKNTDGKNMLGTVENVVTGNEQILIKCL